jgi:S1-C subfamily serine protease
MSKYVYFWLVLGFMTLSQGVGWADSVPVTGQGRDAKIAETNAQVDGVRTVMKELVSAEFLTVNEKLIWRRVIRQSQKFVTYFKVDEVNNSTKGLVTVNGSTEVNRQALAEVLAAMELDAESRVKLISAGALTSNPPVSNREINELLENATVLVVTFQDDEGETFSFGSGFFIAPDLVLTNFHVVEDSWQCFVINKAIGQLVEAKMVAQGSGDKDLAVLQLDSQANISPLSFSTKSKRADRISAWGFPGLLLELNFNLNSTSIPEVVYSSGEINVIYDSQPVSIIAHTAVISQGNSGGPLIDDKGRVVGVNTFLLSSKESYRQANLALPAKDIISFLRANRLPYTVEN